MQAKPSSALGREYPSTLYCVESFCWYDDNNINNSLCFKICYKMEGQRSPMDWQAEITDGLTGRDHRWIDGQFLMETCPNRAGDPISANQGMPGHGACIELLLKGARVDQSSQLGRSRG